MNYRDMNRVAAAVCGLIVFAVIVMIGISTLEQPAAADDVTFFLN